MIEYSSIWARPTRLVWCGQRKPGGQRHHAQAWWPGMVIMHGDTPEAVTAANEGRMPPEYAGPLRKQRTVNKSGTSAHQVCLCTYI